MNRSILATNKTIEKINKNQEIRGDGNYVTCNESSENYYLTIIGNGNIINIDNANIFIIGSNNMVSYHKIGNISISGDRNNISEFGENSTIKICGNENRIKITESAKFLEIQKGNTNYIYVNKKLRFRGTANNYFLFYNGSSIETIKTDCKKIKTNRIHNIINGKFY